jgi:hypothetical protein
LVNPKPLRAAGRTADGVFVNYGLGAEYMRDSRVHIVAGAPHGLMNAVENRKQYLALSSAASSVLTCHYQGVSHAAWPEDKHQSASEETICWPLTAATIECAVPRPTGFSQREKKL